MGKQPTKKLLQSELASTNKKIRQAEKAGYRNLAEEQRDTRDHLRRELNRKKKR